MQLPNYGNQESCPIHRITNRVTNLWCSSPSPRTMSPARYIESQTVSLTFDTAPQVRVPWALPDTSNHKPCHQPLTQLPKSGNHEPCPIHRITNRVTNLWRSSPSLGTMSPARYIESQTVSLTFEAAPQVRVPWALPDTSNHKPCH